MLAALLAWAIGAVLKPLIRRRRPSVKMAGYAAQARLPDAFSFPSSHASSSLAFFTALAVTGHVTFCRFYLGVHFPSDLVGGAGVGVLCGAFVVPQVLGWISGAL